MSQPSPEFDLLSRIELLADLEPFVDDLIQQHEAKRELWFPSDLFGEEEQENPETWGQRIRKLAEGLPDPCRIAIALNLITEEGLPHFHRLLAVHFGDETFWRKWNNLWTAEEDRHGAVLHDYCRETRILHTRTLEKLQFEYLRGGFHPQWDRDPYRVFVYTTLQERATQMSHAGTGRICAEYEPKVDYILKNIAADEARHYSFYRQVFAEVIKRDPDRALESAALVMPAIDMPGISMPGFKEFADVVRRSGIYGPRDYLKIVQDQIRFWQIESLTGLRESGRVAQEKILQIPRRLEKIAEYVENKSRSKTFSFELVFQREFALD
ncbi:MAG: acyl-ACP desaturase [Candidatus Eisenbacteria bacterium]|uniref:Acyl-ACP desaturase n=1 Tax=Eiseniibacteriota bacterium TaxID=2212470 RepID=A0A849ST31_UNCEI|nr:acyl-ACP desaturase [Candidatus Eisenbacteria bacterium]